MKSNEISEDIKWKAVINCDNSYDTLFYYGVKTTGIFCRPSCKAKAPLRKNILFFNNKDDAMKDGFRPCKMCRPDLCDAIYEPNKELLNKTTEILKASYNKSIDLNIITQEIGLSESHLTRLFKQCYGFTPKEYIIKLRIEKSKEFLSSTDIDIIEIAQEVGFRSLSTFYKSFKDKVGCTPKEYRKANNKDLEEK